MNNHEERPTEEIIITEAKAQKSKAKEPESRKPSNRTSQKWFYQEIPYQRKRKKIHPDPVASNDKTAKTVKLVKTATKGVQTKLKEKDSEVSKRLLQVEKISNLILSEVRHCLVRNNHINLGRNEPNSKYF